jgi:hypothetical protein
MKLAIMLVLVCLQTTAVFAQLKTGMKGSVRPSPGPKSDTDAVPKAAPTQVPQEDIARRLLLPDYAWRLRDEALTEALTLNPQSIAPDLRQALITTLERENARDRARQAADVRGEFVPAMDNAEFYPRAIKAMVALRDPQAIPALTGALGTGMMIIDGLLGLGELAVPAVLAVIESNESRTDQVSSGLRALTKFVEKGMLTAGTRTALHPAAAQRLTGLQAPTVIANAIDLATALRDPALMFRVEQLAADPSRLRSHGITDAEQVEWLHRRATAAVVKAKGR